jgi:hypothetical protein
MRKVLLTVVGTLALALFITSCGNDHTSENSMSAISSNTQGAQAAAASIKTARNIAIIGSALSMITAAASSGGSGLPLAPALKRTKALQAGAVTFPVTIDCATNATITGGNATTPDSVTIAANSTLGPFTITFNACRQNTAQVDGVATAQLTGIIALALTLGSDAAPLTVTEYADAASSTVSDVLKTSSTIGFSQAGTTDTYTITGTFENWDYVGHGHEKLGLSGLVMAVTTGAAVVNGANYATDTLLVNGSSAGTVFVSDTDATIGYTEGNRFTNFVIVDKKSVAGSPDFEYLNISGTFSIATTPDKCIIGTFSVATDTDVKIDNATGMTAGGQLTINANAIATFNADGSVSVGVNGGAPETVTAAEVVTLCSL